MPTLKAFNCENDNYSYEMGKKYTLYFQVDLESLNVDSIANDESEDNIIRTLTYDPKPDDGLLFIVAVCGPYSALQKFKYKVCSIFAKQFKCLYFRSNLHQEMANEERL